MFLGILGPSRLLQRHKRSILHALDGPSELEWEFGGEPYRLIRISATGSGLLCVAHLRMLAGTPRGRRIHLTGSLGLREVGASFVISGSHCMDFAL